MAGRRSVGLGFICALGVMVGPAVGTALAAPQIYWGNFGSGTIGAADSDGSAVNQSFMTGFGSGEPVALAVDGQHLYWADRDAGTIGVADFDGTVVNPSLISGIQGVNAIAVNAGHIYWANAATSAIGEANVDGRDVNANFITDADAPFGLAVDGQRLYWTNISTDTVGDANLDGTGVNQSLISGAQGITGLALDGQHLYWGNSTSQTIGRANLDGTDANESFITGAGNVLGVAIYGQQILWSDLSAAGTIGSAPLDGGSGQLGFITGANYPLGLAVSVPVADVSPAAPSPFASTQLGSVSGATTLTVTNTGQAPLLFTGTSLSGADPGDFVIGADGCVAGVAPGASCQLEVYFSPQGVGARSATLQIATNDYANGSLQVPLSGTGATAPVVSSAPQSSPPPPVSTTPNGPQQPAPRVELVSCKTVTKTVFRKVRGKTRKLRVKQQKCSRRLVTGAVGATTGAVDRATISRGGVRYATGTGVQLAGGRSQLVLTEIRPVRNGRYTLTLQGPHWRRTSTITLG
jgi:virginiamycin B lyase